MKLIYQLPHAHGKNIKPSPFDIAISEMVKEKSIQVACPYITLDYFKEVILNGCKDWELLTDVNAFIKSQGKKNKEEVIDFLEEFSTKIKHQDSSHVNVIIAEDRVLIGSENFTEKGIAGNNEMSVIISDVEKVNEIKMWYNEWWQYASHKKIDTIYILNKIKQVEVNESDEERLVRYLKLWNDKIYTEYYFNLAQHIIEKFNINEQDKRLCISLKRQHYRIPITIGGRDILTPYWETKCIGLMMPLEFDEENASIEGWGGGYNTFTNRYGELEAYEIYYKKKREEKFNDITMSEWERVVENELKRLEYKFLKIYPVTWRNKHQAIVYKFICDKEYRDTILNEIYKR